MSVGALQGKAQRAVHMCDARINVWEGSVRSGKTVSSILAWVAFVLSAPAGNLLMVGKTERTLQRNIIDPIVEMLGPKRARLVAGSGELWICGRRVYLAGANNELAQEKIRGLTLVGAYVDEASLVPESFWTMLLSRLSTPGARLYCTTNPDNPSHFLKRDFLDRARMWLDGDGQVHRYADSDEEGKRLNLNRFSFRLEDNPYLDPEYVEQLKREYVGLWYRRFIRGEWVVAEGAVYDMWDPARHVVTDAQMPARMDRWLALGVDHGTANPFAAVLLGVGTDPELKRPRLYLAGEWRWDSRKRRRQLTNAEYVDRLKGWMGELHAGDGNTAGVRPERIYYDPAAAGFGLQLYRDGLSNTGHANNDVLPGIQLVSSLLATGDLVVHESCRGLIDEFGGYCWDPDKQEKGEDAPIKVDDHSLDALRYAIASTEPLWRPYVRSSFELAA